MYVQKRQSHPEECRRAATLERAVFDFRLFGEIFGTLDRGVHSLDGEESRQISRVRRDHDECEEPPHAGNHASRYRSAIQEFEGCRQLSSARRVEHRKCNIHEYAR